MVGGAFRPCMSRLLSLNKSAQLRVLFSFSLVIVSRSHVIIRHVVELASLLLASAVGCNQRGRVSEALTDVLQSVIVDVV